MKGNHGEARSLKAYLKQVEAKLFEHYRRLLADNTLVTAEGLKNAYQGIEKKQHTLLELIDYHNTQLKNSLEWGTLKNYFTTQSYVKEYLNHRLRKKDISLSELSYQFITGLEMFLKGYQPKDHRKPMGNNTVMKHIERLRKMVNLAIKNEWLEKDPFHKFKLKFEKKDRVTPDRGISPRMNCEGLKRKISDWSGSTRRVTSLSSVATPGSRTRKYMI